MPEPDAVVVGSGPNGLAAAVFLAREGIATRVYEANAVAGGGVRSLELTLPGFRHDLCSAIHPMAVASPFFRDLKIEEHGLEWIQPPLCLAHPFDDGSAAVLERSVDATARRLGSDADAYRSLFQPLAEVGEDLFRDLLGPLRWPGRILSTARLAWHGMQSARSLIERNFQTREARALLGGVAGHAVAPMDKAPSAGFILALALAGHIVGWPMPRGGAQRLADSLINVLRSHGGDLIVARAIESLAEIDGARTILLDVAPRELLRLGGSRLPDRYRRRLEAFRHGPGVIKIDWALSAPIPWTADACRSAGTVHLGGTYEEIVASEDAIWRGEHADRPMVLLTQPTLFDPTRAPADRHVGWAYCHVPSGSTRDLTDVIECQVERFAPGFRDTVLARHVFTASQMERKNRNLVGGEIGGGVHDLRQLLARPVARLDPYRTPLDGVYLCSASTPPGMGVHGMCGYFAALAALHDRRK